MKEYKIRGVVEKGVCRLETNVSKSALVRSHSPERDALAAYSFLTDSVPASTYNELKKLMLEELDVRIRPKEVRE